MPKFSVYAIVDAGFYVGEFEAGTKEAAEALAWESPAMEERRTVCHHCAHKLETNGEVSQLLVDEIEE